MTIPTTFWRFAFFGYLVLAAISLIFTLFCIVSGHCSLAAAYLKADEWLVWGVLLVPLFGVGYGRRILTRCAWRIGLAVVARR